MLQKNNLQLKENIKKKLKGDYDIHIFNEIKSTNETLKEMAKLGAKDGTIIIARQQTEGRGTQGRKFFSPLNGLYVSMLTKPKVDLKKSLLLTVATAVAVVKAIKKVLKIKCGIKWVNDIIYKNKKVGGILTEGGYENSSNRLKYAVVGIGLNLSVPKEGFPENIINVAGALTQTAVSDCVFTDLCAEIINKAFKFYKNLNNLNFVKKYQKLLMLKKKEVKYSKNGKIYFGKVVGIDNSARLIVEENGRKTKLCAGEVSLKI